MFNFNEMKKRIYERRNAALNRVKGDGERLAILEAENVTSLLLSLQQMGPNEMCHIQITDASGKVQIDKTAGNFILASSDIYNDDGGVGTNSSVVMHTANEQVAQSLVIDVMDRIVAKRQEKEKMEKAESQNPLAGLLGALLGGMPAGGFPMPEPGPNGECMCPDCVAERVAEQAEAKTEATYDANSAEKVINEVAGIEQDDKDEGEHEQS